MDGFSKQKVMYLLITTLKDLLIDMITEKEKPGSFFLEGRDDAIDASVLLFAMLILNSPIINNSCREKKIFHVKPFCFVGKAD